MIVTVEKPFRGLPHWAQSYIGAQCRTEHGYGKVIEVHVRPSEEKVVLVVDVSVKKFKKLNL